MSLRFKGCFTILAVHGSSIALGILSILLYFGGGRRPLLIAAADLWQATVLGRALPEVSAGLRWLGGAVSALAGDLPLAPWLTGVLLVLAIFMLRAFAGGLFGARTREVTYADVFNQVLLFLPLALLWIWLFSGVMSLAGLFLFIAGYLGGIVASVVLMAELT